MYIQLISERTQDVHKLMTYYTYDKHFVFAQHFVSGRVCCGTSAAGTAYPSGAHEFIPGFSVDQSLIFCTVLFRSMIFFVYISFSH